MMAHDAIIESHVMQAHHANHRRTMGVEYAPRNLVYLSTQNLTLPKGKAKNCCQVHWAVQSGRGAYIRLYCHIGAPT